MIFIDTGAFIARYLVRDQFHEIAIQKWQLLESSKNQCFTSNFVLDESITLIGRYADYHFASRKAQIIYDSKALTILRPTKTDELKALALFDKFADQKVSFTDCISFVLMKEAKIMKTFSFDRHFEHAGFEIF